MLEKDIWRKPASWKQVRGPAGAVVCETGDLRFAFPSWHALLHEKRRDRGHECCVSGRCSESQAKRGCRGKVGYHECEELKESIWLESALVLLRKKTKDDWTETIEMLRKTLRHWLVT